MYVNVQFFYRKKTIDYLTRTLLIIQLILSSYTYASPVLCKKKFVGKFKEATVCEGIGSYTFINNAGKKVEFVFDNYYDQKIPYNLFDDYANTNEQYLNCWFKIKYETLKEIRGESDYEVEVNKIITIKLLNREK